MSGFTAVSFETFNIGKRIKSSKKRYTWKILIDGKEYKIDMYLSRISGKINILINGDIRVKTKRDTEFDIRVPLTIANRSSQIVQIGNMEFDLKIGEGSFNTLYIVNNYSSKPNSS